MRVAHRRSLAWLWIGLCGTTIAAAWTAREGQAPAPPPQGRIEGQIVVKVEGLKPGEPGDLVAFLDGVQGPLDFPIPAAHPTVSQKNARFDPSFLVICRGQTVDMPNDDQITHNVFSYSGPNRFDLGLYPKGSSKSVTFRHAGTVRVYCSIHAKMVGTILVAPSPWFARADDQGRFGMDHVPAGAYQLKTWSSMLPETATPVQVRPGETTSVKVEVGPS